MSAAPLLSVIVPSYNQGQYLGATLDSIFAQDYRPLEVLVVDGASSDNSVDLLRDYAGRHPELRWWSEPDSGVVEAVNKGLDRARGEFAAIQSSDDIYHPGALREAVELLRADPTLGVVCADVDIMDGEGRILHAAPVGAPYTQENFLLRATVVHQSSTVFRLAVVREAGGWRERYFCADSELWLRLSFRTRFLKVDRRWSAWRKHEAQRDREALRMWQDWGAMMHESPELQAAPARLRRAARAGHHTMAVDYNPSGRESFRLLHLWWALLIAPRSLRAIRDSDFLFPRRLWPIWRRIKRRWPWGQATC